MALHKDYDACEYEANRESPKSHKTGRETKLSFIIGRHITLGLDLNIRLIPVEIDVRLF